MGDRLELILLNSWSLKQCINGYLKFFTLIFFVEDKLKNIILYFISKNSLKLSPLFSFFLGIKSNTESNANYNFVAVAATNTLTVRLHAEVRRVIFSPAFVY